MEESSVPEVVGGGGDLRTYGRRRGRKLSPRQQDLMNNLLAQVALNLQAPPPNPLSGLFGRRVAQVWLEIGFGGGEHLIWQAINHPDAGLIGCEPFEDGVVKALSAIDDHGIRNMRLHADDARDVLRWLPDASIDRAFILFPDPWPKARHKKRRLVNASTLSLLARVLRPGAELRVATDIGDYARTMLMAFQVAPEFKWLAAGPADWAVRGPDWPETRYEQKAIREGRKSSYLRFLRA